MVVLPKFEELAIMYALQLDMLPSIMADMMREKYLVWFRTNNLHWQT